jgi:hypothetical protein
VDITKIVTTVVVSLSVEILVSIVVDFVIMVIVVIFVVVLEILVTIGVVTIITITPILIKTYRSITIATTKGLRLWYLVWCNEVVCRNVEIIVVLFVVDFLVIVTTVDVLDIKLMIGLKGSVRRTILNPTVEMTKLKMFSLQTFWNIPVFITIFPSHLRIQ